GGRCSRSSTATGTPVSAVSVLVTASYRSWVMVSVPSPQGMAASASGLVPSGLPCQAILASGGSVTTFAWQPAAAALARAARAAVARRSCTGGAAGVAGGAGFAATAAGAGAGFAAAGGGAGAGLGAGGGASFAAG